MKRFIFKLREQRHPRKHAKEFAHYYPDKEAAEKSRAHFVKLGYEVLSIAETPIPEPDDDMSGLIDTD